MYTQIKVMLPVPLRDAATDPDSRLFTSTSVQVHGCRIAVPNLWLQMLQPQYTLGQTGVSP